MIPLIVLERFWADRGTFYLFIRERARSFNAKGRKNHAAYRARISAAATKQASEAGRLWTQTPSTRLFAKVFYFHRQTRDIDADNISKPVLDCLRGIVYYDDTQVIRRTALKVDMSLPFTLDSNDLPASAFRRLLNLVGDVTVPDFIAVAVGELGDVQAALGGWR